MASVSGVDLWPGHASTTIDRDGLRAYPNQPDTLPELLERSVERYPDAPAIADVGGRMLRYADMWAESARVAATLQHRHGVGPGDQVALLSENSLDLFVGIIATWRVGGVAIMLNARFRSAEVAGQLALVSPKVVLAQPDLMGRLPVPVHPLGEFDSGDARIVPPSLGRDDPALVNFTSGTTSVSRAVVQSHANVVSAAETWVRCAGLVSEDRTVVATPLYHTTGLNGQSLPILAAGGSVAIMPRFSPRRLVDELMAGDATFFHAAPSIYILTLRSAGWRVARELRIGVSGGSFVGRPLVADIIRFAPGIDFRISYGMTETSSPAVLTPPGWILRRPGNAIGVPVPLDDVRVDEAGEIHFRGATVISGRAWLPSGDLGTIDEAGFVTVVDRIKDIVNRGGEKIASIEVEDVLTSHPGVVEAAVVAVPDSTYGEVPVAFVVGDVGAQELRLFAADRLARFKVPDEVVSVPELPRNPSGKVLKRELRLRRPGPGR